MTPRHFLEIDDLRPAELIDVLDRAERLDSPQLLQGRAVGLYFEKPSLRTRHSCEVAVVQLGGYPLTFHRDEVGSGEREPLSDIARVLSGYHAALGGRVYQHAVLEALASAATVPVINLLSDRGHPCQALADLLTMRQALASRFHGATLAWVGDFNNVARSLCFGAAMLGLKLRLACPPDYGPSAADVDRLRVLGTEPLLTHRPEEAVDGALAVHTDVWASMGQEDQATARRQAFEGFTVDDRLMARAPGAVFMHCLPAHRGEEVTASVVDGEASWVIPQAHNRLHAFRGLLWWLLEQASAGGPA